MDKEKEIHASLAVTLQTANATAIAYDKCLVKMKKSLNFWVAEVNNKLVLIAGSVLQ